MPETLLELGKALNVSGDAGAASGYLEEALKSEQNGTLAQAVHLQLLQAYRKLGRTADAERELEAVRKLRGNK